MTRSGRRLAALSAAVALASAAGCGGCSTLMEPSRSWNTPLGAVECGDGAEIVLQEDGDFIGGEVQEYNFHYLLSYRAGGKARVFAQSIDPEPSGLPRLAAQGLALDLHRPVDGRPSWAVGVPDRIPEADYRRFAACLKEKHLTIDAALGQARGPAGVPARASGRYPRLAYVFRDDARFDVAAAAAAAAEKSGP